MNILEMVLNCTYRVPFSCEETACNVVVAFHWSWMYGEVYHQVPVVCREQTSAVSWFSRTVASSTTSYSETALL